VTGDEQGVHINEAPICVTDQVNGELHFTSWEDCDEMLHTIEQQHRGKVSEVWFRGQASSRWKLESTLERRAGGEYSVTDYFRVLKGISREIEAFTGKTWVLPSQQTITEWTGDYDKLSIALFTADRQFPYDYMAHLRHYGFPSPFLDWTGSPYIAAYFAFARAMPNTDVAIYAFVERPNNLKEGGSGVPTIHVVGPNISAPRRHFLQKSRYTICVQFDIDLGWRFVPHQRVFDQSRTDQDVTWKLVIPSSERMKVLSLLDRYNLNDYSLFGSEESLMETLAIREIEQKR